MTSTPPDLEQLSTRPCHRACAATEKRTDSHSASPGVKVPLMVTKRRKASWTHSMSVGSKL